jgi:hypothetical protein
LMPKGEWAHNLLMCGVGLHLHLSIYLSLSLWTCKDYLCIHVV